METAWAVRAGDASRRPAQVVSNGANFSPGSLIQILQPNFAPRLRSQAFPSGRASPLGTFVYCARKERPKTGFCDPERVTAVQE
jgi:hypothetical protein